MRLKQLIKEFGKDKINTLTKYPSILTLHQLGDRGKLKDEFTTDIVGEKMYASEKIDGTNVRIIMYGDEYLIGSRDNILHFKGDLYYDPAQSIVDGFYQLKIPLGFCDKLTIAYGEYFGGRVSSNSKQYGQDKIGFRVIDIVEFDNLDVLELSIEEISRWREHSNGTELQYGQNFLNLEDRKRFWQYDFVPEVEFEISDYTHQGILNSLKSALPQTKVALSENAGMKPEGIVLRNFDRTKIVKLRFEDYERTLK